MKILLAAINAKYIHSNLAIYDLKAYADARLSDESKMELILGEFTINQSLDQILSGIYELQADVVAFSCYIWNIEFVYRVCRELKKVSPNTIIWLGGPEVSYDAESVLKQHHEVDLVMMGEGEEPFYQLVKHATEQGLYAPKDTIHGIAFRRAAETNAVVVSNPPKACIDLNTLPFVYGENENATVNIHDFEHKIIYYESSRGCPFSCSYCLSSIDRSIRFRDMELVKQELAFFLKHHVKQVKFIDRTFNCNPQRALEIWRYIHEMDNGVTNFHFEISADLLDDVALEVLANMRPGLCQLEIGMQTTNPDTIREIRRTMNLETLKQNMLAIHEAGNIHQHLDLIAGLPYEDYESFAKSFDDAFGMKPEQLQLGFLKVLKGSYIHENQYAYDLRYLTEAPYEVLSTRWLSYEDMLRLKQVEEMVEVYYNSGQFKYTLAYLLLQPEMTPFRLFEMLGTYYKDMQYLELQHKRIARYEILLAFAKQAYGTCETFCLELFQELLTMDCYLRDNAKARPSWCSEKLVLKGLQREFFEVGGDVLLEKSVPSYKGKLDINMMHLEAFYYVTETVLEKLLAGENLQSEEKRLERPCYVLFDFREKSPMFHEAKVHFFL